MQGRVLMPRISGTQLCLLTHYLTQHSHVLGKEKEKKERFSDRRCCPIFHSSSERERRERERAAAFRFFPFKPRILNGIFSLSHSHTHPLSPSFPGYNCKSHCWAAFFSAGAKVSVAFTFHTGYYWHYRHY